MHSERVKLCQSVSPTSQQVSETLGKSLHLGAAPQHHGLGGDQGTRDLP